MVEQVKRPGWVYVLHDSNDSGLALQIKLGLNRLGHQIWVRERDAPDQDDWKAHSIGIERAGFIVVLETAALEASTFAQELVEWAEEVPMKRPEIIRVEVEPGHRMTLGGLPVAMRARPRRLVHNIDTAIRKFRKWAIPSSAPVGGRGRYVLLSYASKDADKAAEVRENLAEAGVDTWDYAVSPRQPTQGYKKEIPAAIEKAKAVLFILTRAWSDSWYCQTELDHARESGRRCVWLCFGPGSPPGDGERLELISF